MSSPQESLHDTASGPRPQAEQHGERHGKIRAFGAAALVVAGGNGLLFNLHHSLETGMPQELAYAFGAIPVVLSALMSVIAAAVRCGPIMRVLIWAVVIGTISLSVVAQYDVLMKYLDNQVVAVIYPTVSDIATIVGLEIVINPAKAARALDRLRGGTLVEAPWLVRLAYRLSAAEMPIAPTVGGEPPAETVPDTPVAAKVQELAPEPVPATAPEPKTTPAPVMDKPVPAVKPEPAVEPKPINDKPTADKLPFSPEELDEALLVDAELFDEHGRRASADALSRRMHIGLKKARALRDHIAKSRPVEDRDVELEVKE